MVNWVANFSGAELSRVIFIVKSFIDIVKIALPPSNSIQPTFKQDPILLHGVFDVHYNQASVPEFWSDHPLDIYEAFAQHSFKTLDTCNNVCPRGAPVCTAKTNQEFRDLIQEDLIQQKPFLDRGQYVYSWEKKYLSYPPLTDTKTLPSLTLSRVTVKNVTKGVVTCHVFETIQGRLDVVNGYGRQRTKGDDVVRVWMKGDNNIKDDNNTDYASVGDVTDLGNGSYLYSVKCLWTGNSSLNVAISYPREFIRVVIHQIHVGVARYMTGEFVKGNIKEKTVKIGAVPG
ncbi:uncharacterized protein LOC131928700 [Physella acuta]|uniref:uncharacterized protein LOC131928700 n=1 Tax=Physella acuta TaxID=109671 RepID=UPI0027DC4DB4|nr:uncharacterized protein LOC131928700 [Physella acuta]